LTSFAQTLEQVLKQCGDNLTRENTMKLAVSLKDFRVGLRLPNSRINTTSAEYRVVTYMRLQCFNGASWDEVKAREEGGDDAGCRHLVPQASRDKLTPCGGAADLHLPQAMTTSRAMTTSSEDPRAELDRHLVWFEAKLSPRAAKFIGWLRKPSSRWVRIPIAILLILGGVFSILPVLGLWMLPLGLVLFAQDVPVLQKPIARMLGWMRRKWIERELARSAQ